MKLVSLVLLAASPFLSVSAFGVTPPVKTVQVRSGDKLPERSPLFRRETVRGGAVPGWAAYNDALDKKPLFTKAMTSLVGWALGDVLAQVRMRAAEHEEILIQCC